MRGRERVGISDTRGMDSRIYAEVSRPKLSSSGDVRVNETYNTLPRKAKMKSHTERSSTDLLTNWNDIGAEKTSRALSHSRFTRYRVGEK